MVVTVKLPDIIAGHLGLDARKHPEKRVLEALAVDGYRAGELSRGQVSELLNLSFTATECFLRDHSAPLGITADDVASDAANLEALLAG